MFSIQKGRIFVFAMEGGGGRKKIVNAQSGSGKGGKVKEEKKERESGGTSKAKVELAETGTSKKGNPKPTKCGAQIYQGEQMIFSTLDLSYSNRVAGLSHASNPPTVKNHHQTRGYGYVFKYPEAELNGPPKRDSK